MLRRYPARKVIVGAVAFSRTGDPATGDFTDAKLIKKFGEVPDDLSTLCRVPKMFGVADRVRRRSDGER